ncbi:Imm1 family immunity protein [Crossiella sp. SN42]|uniref:Imm1 family immunity protein n=1 Tax=Crossiella sp. SN42 TaxID=2944808 RepID=UPI00207C2310|nr:Imm1 family immunity protein [Crossiella sp. SN42]MCO1575512.1 Imm1 family immunity protein [Crossiella sp. SN42]
MTETVVSALVNNRLRYARQPSEVEALLAEALSPGAGVVQWFVSDREASTGTDGRQRYYPDVRLLTSVGEDGVSAAVSYLAPKSEEFPDGVLVDSLAEQLSPEPVELTFDWQSGLTFPETAAVPIAAVEEAVREFCRTGGRQPTAVRWQPGQHI